MQIEIHISDFLSFAERQITSLSEDGIIHWFFNGPLSAEQRFFVCNSVQLGSHFLGKLLDRFKNETDAKPTSLVLYGQVKQYEAFILEHLEGRQKLILKNETTGELLKVQYLLDEKLEIMRVVEKANTKIRPMNSPAPCCAMSHTII